MGLRLRPTHWALLLGTVLAEATAIGLSWGREATTDTLGNALNALAFVTAGVLILARHPRHRIGWLMVANGVVIAVLCDLAQGYALAGTRRQWPAAAHLDLIANSFWAVGGMLLAATFVLFPTGTLPRQGRVWPWVLPLGTVGGLVLLAGWMTGDDVTSLLVNGRNPLRATAVPGHFLYVVGLATMTLSMVLGVLAMVLRMRAAAGVERQQLKWMVAAVSAMVLTMPPLQPWYLTSEFVRAWDAVIPALIPLAALAAIWRYHLYDIDLIISRTVLYATLTAVLAGAFAGLVVGLGVVFGRGSTVATALATLVVAAAFRPLRNWLQGFVDRRFDRGRYDAHAEVAAFMGALRAGSREPEEVHDVLDHATARLRSEEARAALRPALEQEASLALEMVGLRAELRAQLAEVRDSRKRIVTAAEEERRRIERDLHDGAQQRLVAIGLALRHLQHELPAESEMACLLDGAVAEVADTIDELREIARGIRPGILDDGLASALRELAQRTRLPLVLDVPDTRFPKDVETAAYFIACEGVTNAAKHSGATRLHLQVREDDGRLVVRVTDDGVGGAGLREGGGLVGVSDRVAAHGGRLSLRSDPGQGTELVAELSCAS